MTAQDAAPRFILREHDGSLATGDEIRSFRIEQRTTKHVTTVRGLGPIGTSVGTGKIVAGKLRVALAGELRDWWGRKADRKRAVYVERSAAGVKAGLRRVREQEQTELDRLDGEIAEAEVKLRQLRELRRAATQLAWQRGNVVRLAEVEAALSEQTW